MKLYFSLILTAVIMAFATGYFALFMKGSYTATPLDAIRIAELRSQFIRLHAPEKKLNLGSIYYLKEQTQLLDPVYTFTRDENKFSQKEDCFGSFTKQIHPLVSDKVWVWEEYRCGLRNFLPTYFFLQFPFIHPSGHSYAYLAFASKKFPFNSKSWVNNHLPLFHALELGEIKNFLGGLKGPFHFLEQMDKLSLKGVSDRQPAILTKNHLLLKAVHQVKADHLEYYIFPKWQIDRFLNDSPYYIKNYRRGKSCFHREGHICWDYNVRHLFKMANTSTLVIFFGLIFLIVLLVYLILSRIRLQRQEDQSRRLALQVLTHEFRTPVANLLLLVEKLHQNFDELSDEMQDTILRMSSGVYRLQRLTEKSRSYLRSSAQKGLVKLTKEELPSFFEFFEDFVLEYEENVSLECQGEDSSFHTDTYWLSIILKNLVENGLFHGVPPVKIKARLEERVAIIEVSDCGECDFKELEKMTSPFVKGQKSEGTGLGLNITAQVIRSMGGKLTFSPQPTTFIIKLKELE